MKPAHSRAPAPPWSSPYARPPGGGKDVVSKGPSRLRGPNLTHIQARHAFTLRAVSTSSAAVRRVLPTLLAVFVLLVLPAPPAQAHPFGDPQTVELSTDGDNIVQVRWNVGMTDDLTWLAVHLGELPEDRIMLDGAVLYETSDAQALAASPSLDDYLLEHIRVTVDGDPCTGSVLDTQNLGMDGAKLAFSCVHPIDRATVSVTMLTDLHPAYRTMATGPDGQRFAYSSDQPAHDWTFDMGAAGNATTSDLGRSAVAQMSSVLFIVAATGMGIIWLLRRRRSAQS